MIMSRRNTEEPKAKSSIKAYITVLETLETFLILLKWLVHPKLETLNSCLIFSSVGNKKEDIMKSQWSLYHNVLQNTLEKHGE